MTVIRDRYCIVGIGETPYVRGSERTTRSLGTEAIRRALRDAGLGPNDVDGMMSYHGGINDSTSSQAIAEDLGIRLDFYVDCTGGGSSTEMLIGLACGAIEAGMCTTVAIFRSMNGYSGRRIGGTPTGSFAAASVIKGPALEELPYGYGTAAQRFQFAFARHMYEFGTTSEQLAQVKVTQSHCASNNPKALYRSRVTIQDVLNSRWIVKPSCHLLDCCVESDNATCIIVTGCDRARDLRQMPIYIMAVAGRTSKPFANHYYVCDPIVRQPAYYARRRVFADAGVGPSDIDVTGAYDAFTFTPLFLLEGYGFCELGGGGAYVTSGITELGGSLPNNTSGGLLCEGYTHGMSLVIENVRQLRHQADDFCPGGENGIHSYDYSEGCCRQVRNVEIAMNMGEHEVISATSALILRR